MTRVWAACVVEHCDAKGQQHPERVHLENADIGNHKRHQRTEVAKRARHHHPVVAVGNWRRNGIFGHDALRISHAIT
jgi:hypothetical protein